MINICNGINKNGRRCKNKIKNNKYCWKHFNQEGYYNNKNGKINIIPNEIYIIIYSFLEFNDKINFSNTNRRSYIIFKDIIKSTNINLLLDKNIKSSYYIKNYLEKHKINIFMNLNYDNNYLRGLEEIDYKFKYNKKEIIIYKNHIYENNNKEIFFGFETKKLKCVDDEIKVIADLLKKIKI